MKIENRTLKYFILVGLIALTNISESFGQVITRVLPPEDKIENYIPWYNPDEEVPTVNAPTVDVEAVLLEDQQTGRTMPRIGIKKDVSYTVEDGRLIEKGSYSLWSMTLRSANAKSMSVRFENTNLPENAVMYLFNEESRFIVGPIKRSNFKNGVFQSDYVNGDYISVYVFFPSLESSSSFSIDIPLYYHGVITLMDQYFDDDFGTSAPCNVNVACEQGVGWGCQINSVCKITAGGGSGTGTLINNDCCDLTPFVLTANHNLPESGVDPIYWNFRFHYQSPVCNPSEEPNPLQWVTYLGATINASWEDTDFLLLELNDRLNHDDNLSFSGWDRRDVSIEEATMIHHPRGDVKKISFDDDPMITTSAFSNSTGSVVLPAGNAWSVVLNEPGAGNFGVMESGSSGCGWFNEDGRIIGTHSLGQQTSCVSERTYIAGRFFPSWNGNGTPDSRLRDWLGASINPNTMDCMVHPFIEGSEVLCTDPETYTLINNMPCAKTVTWRVEPANLFASPGSGNGVTASLWGNATSSGPATLIYTLSAEGCNDAEVEYDLFVGRPCTFELHSFPTEICVGEQGETFLNLFEDCLGNYSSIEWDFYGAISGYGYDNKGRYAGITTGYGYVCVTVTNDCGSKEVCDRILVKDCGGGFGFRNTSSKSGAAEFKVDVFPNPANEIIEVACSGYTPGTRIAASLISMDGKVVREVEEYSHNFKVDMADLPSGLYVLQLNADGVIYHEKIVKL
jgi:hypothetical protein